MDFVTSHFGKMNLWPVEHFFQHMYLSSKLDSPLIKTLERENLILMISMLKKVFNWSEVHLSEMTCYKIHTLVSHFLKILCCSDCKWPIKKVNPNSDSISERMWPHYTRPQHKRQPRKISCVWTNNKLLCIVLCC